MHPACVGLQCFERPKKCPTYRQNTVPITLHNNKEAEAVEPEYWVLFTLRWVTISESSAYKYASCFDKKWRTVRCYDLNNEYYFNVTLQVARPYG